MQNVNIWIQFCLVRRPWKWILTGLSTINFYPLCYAIPLTPVEDYVGNYTEGTEKEQYRVTT
jgi:hypothetical protein